MGDEDGREAQPLLEGSDLLPHPQAEAGVQVGQRLVEQDDLRLHDERAGQGNTLLLAAGELVRVPLGVLLDAHGAQARGDAVVALLASHLLELEPESDVLLHREVREKGVGLEHHRHRPLVRGCAAQRLAIQGDLPGGDLFEARDHAQRGGLAAARGAEEGREGPGLDVEADAVDGFLGCAAPAGVRLGDVHQVQGTRDDSGVVLDGRRVVLLVVCHDWAVLMERLSWLMAREARARTISTRTIRTVQ